MGCATKLKKEWDVPRIPNAATISFAETSQASPSHVDFAYLRPQLYLRPNAQACAGGKTGPKTAGGSLRSAGFNAVRAKRCKQKPARFERAPPLRAPFCRVSEWRNKI